MRIVSYNILDGGVGRADPLGEVIEAQRADVVALIEADDEQVVERIARRLEMDVVWAQGKGHAVALLSGLEIVESVNWGLLRPEIGGGALEARVKGKGGAEWVVGVVDVAEQEIGVILELLAEQRSAGVPQLLCGNFSAAAAARVQQDGYLDTLKDPHPYPLPEYRERGKESGGEHPIGLATYPTLEPRERRDYIFAHGIAAQRIGSAWIETDRLARYASDHYPVGVEIM